MIINSFNKMLKSNKEFWSKVNKKDDSNGYLLYETFYSEPAIIYGISKTALVIANIKNLKPLGLINLRSTDENKSLVKSMNDNVIGNKFEISLSVVKNIFTITKLLFSIKDKRSFLDLKTEQYKIGKYIYDHTLANYKIPEVNKIDIRVRKRIFVELSYFFYFKDLIKSRNIKMIILGDNVYRYGLLFELAKHNNIECISPINLNTFSMRKYQVFSDFYIHDRKPEQKILNALDINKISIYVDKYFSNRFNATIEQHDVLKAFSNSKIIYKKEEIIKHYNLKEDLPIIVVMNHIFCDAPHAYPDGLYDDYKEWLVQTVINLKKNKKINFLVKEHPSAELYDEKGVVKEILEELNSQEALLEDDVHSLTILNELDTVITYGGTIGQEFIYKGKPVVLAGKPPYSGFGFTVEPDTKKDYENLLESGIENLTLLNAKQKENAKRVIYYDFVLMDNYSNYLEIGGERFYRGRDFNYSKFYKRVLNYNLTPIEDQYIYKLLKNFIESDNIHLMRNTNE